MNHWNEIEHAAADRHARDLRNAKIARQLRAARDDQPKQSWLSKLLHRHSTQQARATNVGLPTDSLADAPAKAH